MIHSERIRESKEKKMAVLFVHGILGTPNQFRELIPLVPQEWSCYAILLDGHGAGVRDFSHSSMDIWRDQVARYVDLLCSEYEHLILVGHSMGTLFVMQEAVKHPLKVKQIILLASPLAIHLTWGHVRRSLKVIFEKVDENDPQEVAARAGYSIDPDRCLWRYLGWIPRYMELFKEIALTRQLIPQITVPCAAIQSMRDELVSNKAYYYLKKNRDIKIMLLKNSGHIYYAPEDLKRMKYVFAKLLKR